MSSHTVRTPFTVKTGDVVTGKIKHIILSRRPGQEQSRCGVLIEVEPHIWGRLSVQEFGSLNRNERERLLASALRFTLSESMGLATLSMQIQEG